MTTYYRVDRVNAYSEGDIINLIYPNDIPREFCEIMDMLAPGGLSPHGLLYLYGARASAGDINVAIDFALELFRRSFFDTKPSRYQSIFAWDNLDDARSFMSRLIPEFPDCAIYELSTESENIHKGDMSILANNKTNLVYADILRLYWSGSTYTDEPLWEFLLPLPVTVGRRVG